MSFLAPIFLLGMAAVGLPILFHLVRRSTRERTVFSSLMFLSPSLPTLSRRNRLEDILLLLLRCAVICLLAFAFARPFFRSATPPAAPAAPKRILLLLDTSASMRRGDLWAQARTKALALARHTAPGDQLALNCFDRNVTPLLRFEEWNEAEPGQRVAVLQAKLDQITPGWASTSLGQALVNGAEVLASDNKNSSADCELVLISDMQEGSRLGPVQGYEWPKSVHLTVEALKLPPRSNASLQLVSSGDETNNKTGQVIRVKIANAADSKREEFKVAWVGKGAETVSTPQQVYVPAGTSRVLPLSVPPGLVPRPECVRLTGDDDEFDNSIFVAVPEPLRLYVTYIGSDSETDPKQQLYFLKRAFQETARESVLLQRYGFDQALPMAEVSATTLLVAGGDLTPERAGELRTIVSAGKSLLFVVTSEAAGRSLAPLLGLSGIAIREAAGTDFAILAGIEFQHPLFTPFADSRYSDFSRIHFWRHRVLDPAGIPQSRILARFDDGAPALLEVAVGKGRVLILTSGWNPQESQLALSTKFVPFLYSLLEYSGAPLPPPMQLCPGDGFPIAVKPGQQGFNINNPDGSVAMLPASATIFTNTLVPGIYQVSSSDTRQRFVVNLDPAESRTTPLPADQLESMAAPVSAPLATLQGSALRQIHLKNAEIENRQKLWRWLIITTMAVVLVETLLSLRAAKLPAAGPRGLIPAELAFGAGRGSQEHGS
jgi:hypothetical protein